MSVTVLRALRIIGLLQPCSPIITPHPSSLTTTMSSSSSSTPPSGPDDSTRPDHPERKNSPPRVVVVGAGFAGIAAAGTLREGGVDDVIVLEAQDRPGGRVNTVQLEGGFVDIGAQFIHGETGNSLFELAEKYGLLLDKGLYQHGQTSDSSAEDFRDNHFFTADGRLLPPERAAQLLSAINQIFRDYSNSFFHEENKLSSAHADLKPAPKDILLKQNVENEQSQSDDMIDTDLNRQQETHTTSSTESGWASEEDCDEEFSERPMKELSRKDDYIIQYGGAAVEDGCRKQENTFVKVLKISRERILLVGDEPEEIKLAVLRWMEQWEYTDNAGRLQDLSLQAYGKYGYLPGFGMTLTTSGIENVFKAFLRDSLPQESLHLNTPVKTIFWQPAELSAPEKNPGKNFEDNTSGKEGDGNGTNSDRKTLNTPREANGLKGRSHHQNGSDPDPQLCHNPVKLVCENGEEFWADHVIVTSSMGYLKENEAAMFQPALPEKLRDAVLQMGFGTVAKVFVVWDRLQEVLDPDMEGIQLLWVEGQQVRPPSDRTAPKTKSGGNWYDFLQGFERVKSHKGALLTWLAGEEAEIMEQLPEEEVKDVLYELLVQFLGRPQLPPPKKVVRSVWHDNQYIRGGYSYLPSNMDSRSHDLLSLPLPSTQNPVLQLCGEATSRRFYSSVHGAIDSGQRAARVILRHYR